MKQTSECRQRFSSFPKENTVKIVVPRNFLKQKPSSRTFRIPIHACWIQGVSRHSHNEGGKPQNVGFCGQQISKQIPRPLTLCKRRYI